MDQIERLFALLDEWRILPKYQLERRADIFFGLYLHEFLQDKLGVPLAAEIIPEFPIHLRSLGYPVRGESSCNVDFLLLRSDLSTAYFVELKTEGLSRRDKQDQYLVDAQRVGLCNLLQGLLQITAATKQKFKYLQLLLLLERLKLISLPEAFHRRMGQKRQLGLTADLGKVAISSVLCPIEILYLQPFSSRANEIGFAEFGEWIGRRTDPLSLRFAKSLVRWAEAIGPIPSMNLPSQTNCS